MSAGLDHARHYASALGWHVLPLYEVGPDGRCTCGDADCGAAGKHPRIRGWQHEATDDLAQIEEWWTTWPNANVAVHCGRSGLVVFDLDVHEEGYDGREELPIWLAARQLRLPATLSAATGGGGLHQSFRANGHELRQDIGVCKGVDVKAGNSYVVVQPSNHASGERYAFSDPGVPLADLPHEVAEQLPQRRRSSVSSGTDQGVDGPAARRGRGGHPRAPLRREPGEMPATEGTRRDRAPGPQRRPVRAGDLGGGAGRDPRPHPTSDRRGRPGPPGRTGRADPAPRPRRGQGALVWSSARRR